MSTFAAHRIGLGSTAGEGMSSQRVLETLKQEYQLIDSVTAHGVVRTVRGMRQESEQSFRNVSLAIQDK